MEKKWKWFVYIIECLDETYYTGMTWNPSTRFEQHLSKLGSRYTAKHGIKKLVYLEEHTELEITRRREIQIKGWNKKKKEKLINGEWKKEW